MTQALYAHMNKTIIKKRNSKKKKVKLCIYTFVFLLLTLLKM
jgi:hypothetical protein